MDSARTCSLLEMTMKLVNRITLVRAHIVMATIMRMIICFMIFPFSSCELPKARLLPNLRHTDPDLSTKHKTHLPVTLFLRCIRGRAQRAPHLLDRQSNGAVSVASGEIAWSVGRVGGKRSKFKLTPEDAVADGWDELVA